MDSQEVSFGEEDKADKAFQMLAEDYSQWLERLENLEQKVVILQNSHDKETETTNQKQLSFQQQLNLLKSQNESFKSQLAQKEDQILELQSQVQQLQNPKQETRYWTPKKPTRKVTSKLLGKQELKMPFLSGSGQRWASSLRSDKTS